MKHKTHPLVASLVKEAKSSQRHLMILQKNGHGMMLDAELIRSRRDAYLHAAKLAKASLV